MNYKEARVYLDSVSKYGSVLGLENIRQLLKRLGNPQDDLRFIHIAGTNGKGSLLAYISTILRESGYTVGRYISPTLFSYRERIQVNEVYIERDALARLTTQIAEAVEDMKHEGMQPTVFEIETAMAFLYFKEKACDIVVLEVGFGGLEDATNVISTTVLEVITKIGIDHKAILGDTVEEIARNKAGIIKPCTQVVTMEQKKEVMDILREVCNQKRALLHTTNKEELGEVSYRVDGQKFRYRGEDYDIALIGTYQVENAMLAIEAVKVLRTIGYEIPKESLKKGLQNTIWRGRFTILRTEPYVILDGAHNVDGAMALKDSLETYFPNRKITYIMGMFRDKEYEKVVGLTAPLARRILTIETPNNPRALPKEELAEVARKYHSDVKAMGSMEEAFQEAFVDTSKEDVIVVFGSLSFLAEMEETLYRLKGKAKEND